MSLYIIQAIVEKQYDVGRLTRIREIFGGFVNRSFAVWIGQQGRSKKFFMREYNPSIAESEIRFEPGGDGVGDRVASEPRESSVGSRVHREYVPGWWNW